MTKINEEHMAKLFNGFGVNTQSPTPPANEQNQFPQSSQYVSSNPIPSTENKTSCPTEETLTTGKRPRKNRVSFMCRISETNLMKIRLLSATSGRSVSDFIDQSVSSFLADYEAKNGNILART